LLAYLLDFFQKPFGGHCPKSFQHPKSYFESYFLSASVLIAKDSVAEKVSSQPLTILLRWRTAQLSSKTMVL
jgi:hypothetical protein